MKKSKRILSLALAATMALGAFSMSASALDSTTTTITPSTTPITQIPIYKSVKINAGASIPEETFKLVMSRASDDDVKDQKVGTVPVEVGPALTEGEGTSYVQYTFNGNNDTSSSSASQVTIKGEDVILGYKEAEEEGGEETPILQGTKYIDVSGLTFDHSGIYRYYVSEDPTDVDSYISTDENKFMVNLYVYPYNVLKAGEDEQGEDHTHEAACYEQKYLIGHVAVTKLNKDGEAIDKPSEIRFTNTINAADLEIRKVVTGQEYTDDEDFTFYIKIPEGGDNIDLSAGSSLTGTIYNITTVEDEATGESKEARTVASTITLNVKGKNEAGTVATGESGDYNAFTLKKDQVLVITAPVSMVFYVAEKNVTGEGYTQVYQYEESGQRSTETLSKNTGENTANAIVNNEMYILKGTVNTNGTKVTYTNSRIQNVSTGVSVDLIPYVLVMLIAVCGAVLFISKKRRIAR
jgi:hypothetical protein